jgi:hypothetical protein
MVPAAFLYAALINWALSALLADLALAALAVCPRLPLTPERVGLW